MIIVLGAICFIILLIAFIKDTPTREALKNSNKIIERTSESNKAWVSAKLEEMRIERENLKK